MVRGGVAALPIEIARASLGSLRLWGARTVASEAETVVFSAGTLVSGADMILKFKFDGHKAAEMVVSAVKVQK